MGANTPIFHQLAAAFRSKSPQLDQGRSLQEFYCIEINAGTGRLTPALRAMGMKDSFGVDCELPSQLRSPMIKYDLLKSDHVTLVQNLNFISTVHFCAFCASLWNQFSRPVNPKTRQMEPSDRQNRLVSKWYPRSDGYTA